MPARKTSTHVDGVAGAAGLGATRCATTFTGWAEGGAVVTTGCFMPK